MQKNDRTPPVSAVSAVFRKPFARLRKVDEPAAVE